MPNLSFGGLDSMNDHVPPDATKTVVIVGAGIAGIRTALTLRECDFEGRIVLLGEEEHEPYDRPPLSKSVLVDPQWEQHIGLDPQDELTAGKIDIRLSARCIGIDLAAHQVTTAIGGVIDYDYLVLATGSRVRTLAEFPAGSPGIHYLRSLDDALALRSALSVPRRVAIIGAGVIGLEVTASLSMLGHDLYVIDPASRVMARSTAPELSSFIARRHRSAGVSFKLETTVKAVARNDDRFRLALSDGSEIEADLVVVGVGVVPNSELASACGLEVTAQGIVVDARGRTGDPSVFAAGEVAFHVNVRTGCHERQETWAHAVAHGEHVARAIMGSADGYAERTSYWTDQFDVNIQVVGDPIGEQNLVRGNLDAGQALIFHLAGGKVTGISAVNSARELRAARKLLGLTIDDQTTLIDPEADLKALAAAADNAA